MSEELEPAAAIGGEIKSHSLNMEDYKDTAFRLKDTNTTVGGIRESERHELEDVCFAGEDIADKLEEMTTAHGYVIKDEEAVKNLIQVLRSKNDND